MIKQAELEKRKSFAQLGDKLFDKLSASFKDSTVRGNFETLLEELQYIISLEDSFLGIIASVEVNPLFDDGKIFDVDVVTQSADRTKTGTLVFDYVNAADTLKLLNGIGEAIMEICDKQNKVVKVLNNN